MSGSGGYYKYRCKYFYTHNCPNWVWMNNAVCADCLAEGRDAQEMAQSQPWQISKDIFVPQVMDGTIHYTLMEIVASESGTYWTLRHKVQNHRVPTISVTSSTPNPAVMTAGLHIGY